MKEIRLDVEFTIGETVYHRYGDGDPGVVVSILLLPNDSVTYNVAWNETQCSASYAFELSREPVFAKGVE